MSNQRNNSGMQLSSSNWLRNHHEAKKQLRTEFAEKIAKQQPQSIIDIGCGSGNWLSIYNEILPKNCKFIGIDIDSEALQEAKRMSKNWDRDCEWLQLDINKYPEKIPAADLTLIYNFSSYVKNLDKLLSMLSLDRGFKKISIRQFAGDEIKFGPLKTVNHTTIDWALKNSMQNSKQIKYFDVDRLIYAVSKSGRTIETKNFELFTTFSPFQKNVWPYVKGTVEWTLERMPDNEQKVLHDWLDKAEKGDPSLYFYSMDWVALLV